VTDPFRAAAVILGGVLLTVLTGCGVPLQSNAEPLPPNVLPAPLKVPSPAASPSPSASTSPSAVASPEPAPSRLRLWFVQDDGLAAAESDLPAGSSPDLVLQSLAVGPTAGQAAEGLRTVARDPLTGLPLVSVAPATTPSSAPPASPATLAATGPPVTGSAPPSAAATVRLSPAFTALPPAEQVLLLGQVVLSLTGSGQATVAFTDDAGTPLAVPLPDGRLLDVPATARDYAGLIVRP
jgi:hypothetical protein